LRKSREDRKNEPGAADFYYGEMEMRRHSARFWDRFIITLYWALSGYGLRASRALGALLALAAITVALLVTCGLATAPTDQRLAGTLGSYSGSGHGSGRAINLTVERPAPTVLESAARRPSSAYHTRRGGVPRHSTATYPDRNLHYDGGPTTRAITARARAPRDPSKSKALTRGQPRISLRAG
jgi:hypothetical protein